MPAELSAQSSDPPTQDRPDLLELALAVGLLTGIGESCLLMVKRFLRGRFITVGEHALWMAPIAETLVFLLAAVCFLAITRRMTRERRERSFMILLVTLSLMTMLTLWGRFHWVTVSLLSFGIGLRASGFLARRLPQVERVAFRSIPILLAVVGMAVIAVFGEQWYTQRHRLRDQQDRAMPNVLLIILDTVRGFNLGLYGYSRHNTPELERWAGNGTVFDRAFSASSWTLPSHAAMFTGRWQTELSVRFNRPLDGTWPTLAERLTDAGYAAGGFVANLIYTPRESGLARGFSHYEDFGLNGRVFLRSATLVRKLVDRPRIRWLLRPLRPALWKTAPEVTDGALDWIGSTQGRPWFAFLNYMEAHDPWYVPAPYDTLYGSGAMHVTWEDIHTRPLPPVKARQHFTEGYDAAIAYLDREIGRLLDTLAQRGALKNTVVVITSDHGEEMGEHNFFGHGANLYRPAVQVPLLILSPGCAGRHRQATPLSLQDFPATVMDLAGITEHPFPGHSFAGLFCRDAGAPQPTPLFSVLRESKSPGHPTMVSVVEDSLRYISNGRGMGELFNFERDPWERTNLATTAEMQNRIPRFKVLADSLRQLPQWKR